MFTIRNAEKTDYEMVRMLEDAVFHLHRQARPDYFREQSQYTEKDFEELLTLPVPISLVAVCDGKLVGICFGKIMETKENAFCKSRKIAVIEDLYVLPEYRGRGIASALMERAKELAASGKAEALELCVWGFNENALSLYRKMGLEVQYYRMEKRLDETAQGQGANYN